MKEEKRKKGWAELRTAAEATDTMDEKPEKKKRYTSCRMKNRSFGMETQTRHERARRACDRTNVNVKEEGGISKKNKVDHWADSHEI